MSSEVDRNIHIASSNLTLDEVEARRARRATQSVDPASRPESAPDSLLADKSRSEDPDQVEPFIVVSVPVVGMEPEAIAQPATSQLENRLQRLPQTVHTVPFVVDDTKEGKPTKRMVSEDTRASETSRPNVARDFVPEYVSSIPAISLEQEDPEDEATPEKKEELVRAKPPVRADISETPDDWLPDRDTDEKRSNKQAKPLNAPKQAFRDLTDRVLEQFPLGPSSLLLVADVDGKSSGYAVAYQLALQLAQQNVGRILVVDAHFESRKLSERLSLGSECGLADLLCMRKRFSEMVCDSELPNLDVLPVGTESMCKRRNPDSTWIADHVLPLKEAYQFVIVSVGNVFHRSAADWAPFCDASYMALELAASNQTIAKSGVLRLQQYGARLMGCVVTDAAAAA